MGPIFSPSMVMVMPFIMIPEPPLAFGSRARFKQPPRNGFVSVPRRQHQRRFVVLVLGVRIRAHFKQRKRSGFASLNRPPRAETFFLALRPFRRPRRNRKAQEADRPRAPIAVCKTWYSFSSRWVVDQFQSRSNGRPARSG